VLIRRMNALFRLSHSAKRLTASDRGINGLFGIGIRTQNDRITGRLLRRLAYVFMILRPAFRFLIGPRPFFVLAARFFAAVILPPRVFFAIAEDYALMSKV
jgi:hypothetical protein